MKAKSKKEKPQIKATLEQLKGLLDKHKNDLDTHKPDPENLPTEYKAVLSILQNNLEGEAVTSDIVGEVYENCSRQLAQITPNILHKLEYYGYLTSRSLSKDEAKNQNAFARRWKIQHI